MSLKSKSQTPSSPRSPTGLITIPNLTTNLEFEGDTDVTYQAVDKGPKCINQYVLGEVLGKGSYAKVREAIDSMTLKRVAVKIIKLRVIKKITGAMAALNREINIMKKLKHKVPFFTYYLTYIERYTTDRSYKK
jgi:serine/threonine protein kinase